MLGDADVTFCWSSSLSRDPPERIDVKQYKAVFQIESTLNFLVYFLVSFLEDRRKCICANVEDGLLCAFTLRALYAYCNVITDCEACHVALFACVVQSDHLSDVIVHS